LGSELDADAEFNFFYPLSWKRPFLTDLVIDTVTPCGEMHLLLGFGIAASLVCVDAYNNGVGKSPPMGWNTWCTQDLCGLLDRCTEKEVHFRNKIKLKKRG
jgi:hypothetical protein